MTLPLPWKTSPQQKLSSRLHPDEAIAEIKQSIDFEGNLSAVDHFICGDKDFIGSINKEKLSFMIFCRHGSQGTPFFARVAHGEVKASASGSILEYKFTLRAWDRFFLLIGLALALVFNGFSLFYLLLKPGGESLVCAALTAAVFLLVWFAPRIAQWHYASDEKKIESLLRSIADK